MPSAVNSDTYVPQPSPSNLPAHFAFDHACKHGDMRAPSSHASRTFQSLRESTRGFRGGKRANTKSCHRKKKKKQRESSQANAVIAIKALGRRSAMSKSDADGGLSGNFLAKTPGLEAQGVWTAGKARRVHAHTPNGGYPHSSKLQAQTLTQRLACDPASRQADDRGYI